MLNANTRKVIRKYVQFQGIALFLVGYLLFTPALMAQHQTDGLVVKGKIIDTDTKAPLPYATVSLYNHQDSTLAAGGITDEAGLFSLETQPGHYYANINFLVWMPMADQLCFCCNGYEYRTKTAGTVGKLLSG